jgi:phosphohistidine phosphatase
MDPDDPDCPPDPERPLTRQGQARTRAAARGLRFLGAAPSLIFTSPLTRARETAAIVAEACDSARPRIVVIDALLPDADPARLQEVLASHAKAQEVLCSGHAPHLDRVLSGMLGVPGNRLAPLKKAGAAVVEFDGPPRGRGRLVGYFTPRVLRRLGIGGRLA